MDKIFRYNDPAKGAIEITEIEGWVLPKPVIDLFLIDRTVQQQIDDIKDLADVIVCAYAKCGMYLVIVLASYILDVIIQTNTVQQILI